MLGADNVVIDEFTSALDRSTARACARGLGAYVRAHGMRGLVVATCHGDLVAELEPDWVFETGRGEMSWLQRVETPREAGPDAPCREGGEGAAMGEVTIGRAADFWNELLKRPGAVAPLWVRLMPPKVEVRLLRATLGAWEHFREHHYKTETISGDAEAFVALARREGPEGWLLAPGGDARGGPVGFVATIRQAGKAKEGGLGPRRAHRTVVLPEWQGLGVGTRLSDAVAELYVRQGREYYGQTVHPRLGAYRDGSPRWEATKYNHTTSCYKIENWKQRNENVRVRLRNPRFLYSHRYVGENVSAAHREEPF